MPGASWRGYRLYLYNRISFFIPRLPLDPQPIGKILTHLRTLTDKQDLNNQKLKILEYAQKNGLQIDDFISISIFSRKSRRERRRIDELLEKLEEAGTLIMSEVYLE